MKIQLAAVALATVMAGCAFTPPTPPQPADSPRVPVNLTAPLSSGGSHE
ncbi:MULTISPECIES: conjugal transfer protein [Alcaligenes]|nr:MULTISPECIES: conjugal transfer protein [Alcaligenes]HRO18865.1 conjugal transfer protein [Alcaligenes phenolicus]HRP14702.1 conjugal transfer protein [Alcaligenes phenolicus]